MQALRVKPHLNRMLACGDIHYTQDIVSTGNIHRLSVNLGLPARIIDLRENSHPILSRRSLIYQAIRFIAGQTDDRQGILITFCHTLQLIFKLRIDHCCLPWKNIIQRINLFICIIDILHLIHKPGVTIRIRVLNRNRLPLLSGREDKVLRIQHIQHTEFRSVHTIHRTACGGNFLIGILHFRSYMMIDHFLITTQLGRMITTHTLMPI